MKHVLKPFAKSVLLSLGLAAASVADGEINLKNNGLGMST